jgi:hypothetical protein
MPCHNDQTISHAPQIWAHAHPTTAGPTPPQSLWPFWRDVQLKAWPEGGAPVLLPPEEFFTRSWAGRGRQYRLLVEPLEIANWYIQVCGRDTQRAQAAMPGRDAVCGRMPGPWLRRAHARTWSRTHGQTPTQL